VIERLIVAAPEGWQSPSARYRLGPVARAGLWQVDAVATGTYPGAGQAARLLELGGPDATLVLQRVMPSREDIQRLRRAYGHLVFDIDDAIYAVPPDLASPRLKEAAKQAIRLLTRGSRTGSSRKRPLERTLARVDACVAGNSILAEFAGRHARRVIEIPTTVEPEQQPPATRADPPVVVWLGLRANLQHLALTREALRALAQELEFRLRIISSATWKDAPVPVDFIRWSPEAAREGLLTASVGLAPLTDDPWTRGKCAFRSIQYGGNGLPTIASPVGITHRVVLHGQTGFLARSTKDWEQALRALLTNPQLVAEMGAAALHHIGENYSDALVIDRWRTFVASLEATGTRLGSTT
jgi:glycosyltransferase involved in cell wall biosynthesis